MIIQRLIMRIIFVWDGEWGVVGCGLVRGFGRNTAVAFDRTSLTLHEISTKSKGHNTDYSFDIFKF